MKKNITAVLTALAVAIAFAAPVTLSASDKPAGKDAKVEAPASTEPTYSVACPSPCDFSVKGHNKSEIVAVIKEHAKAHHNMTMTDEQVAGMMKVKEAKK